MNKHLNNWLDEVEGKPKEISNNAIKKEIAGRMHYHKGLMHGRKNRRSMSKAVRMTKGKA